MFQPSLNRLAAAAISAAALLMIGAAACGGDDGETSPSPTATEEPSPSPSVETPADSTAGVLDGVIDLAATPPAMTVIGKNTEDLVTGSTSVALGDFNDDGMPDLLMGASQADGPNDSRPDAGEAYVFFGPLEGEADLLEATPDITIYGASGDHSGGDGLGFTAFAGDLNDDGVDDFMVGAPGVTAGFDPRTDQGRLYVFYGGSRLDSVDEFDLAEDVFDLTVTGSEGFSRLSTDVDLGDINGDGHTDLVVSSPFAGREPGTPPGSERTGVGEVYVIFGTGDDLTGEKNMAAGHYDVLFGGEGEFGQFGASISVGDFNGDSYDDVLVGSHRSAAANGRPSGGAAYVFFGSSDIAGRISVEDDAQDVSILGADAGAAFGFPVAAGDFNGDGNDDLAIGAQSETMGTLMSSGAVRIFYGSDDLPSTIDVSTDAADVTVPGPGTASLIPSAMIAADLNGDGTDDLAVSSTLSGSEFSRNDGGLVYFVPGSPELPAKVDLTDGSLPPPVLGPEAGGQLGVAMAFGEITGGEDGLVLLAPGYSPNEQRAKAGAVYVVPLELG